MPLPGAPLPEPSSGSCWLTHTPSLTAPWPIAACFYFIGSDYIRAMSAVTAECSPLPATPTASVTIDAATWEPDESMAKRPRVESSISCCLPAASHSHSGIEQLEQDQQECGSHASTDVTQQLSEGHSAVSSREPPSPAEPAAAAAAPPSIPAPASNTGNTSDSQVTAAPASKRTYPCRICHAPLASTSSRSRHERAKHGGVKPAVTAAAPAAVAAEAEAVGSSGEQHPSGASAAMLSPSRPFSILEHSSRQSRPALTSYLQSPSLARGWQASSGTKRTRHQRDEGQSESDVDAELLQFVSPTHDARLLARLGLGDGRQDSGNSTSSCDDGAQMLGSSSGSSASSSSPTTDSDGHGDAHDHAHDTGEPVPGMPTLLTDEELQDGCYAFLQWVCTPSLTPVEALVKARRVRSITQLLPIKRNLRFCFALLNAKGVTNKVDLSVLTGVDVCQALWDALSERGVGSGRIHTVFLLVKKILVHLSSAESVQRRQFLPPTIYDSWLYVDGVCSEAGQRRKQESRNRAVLGSRASQQLLQQEYGQRRHAPEPFVVPKVWNAPVMAERHSSSASSSSSPPPSPVSPPGLAAAVRGRAAASPDGEMSKGELQQITKHCLANLHAYIEQERSPINGDKEAALPVRDRWYMALLVTGVLCLGLAPRSQVLAQLRIGSTLTKHNDDGRYWIQLLAQHNKNGKPTMFALPAELTAAMDHYLNVVRPRLLTAKGGGAHDYAFVKRDGSAPRTDFTGCTHLVTQQVLGQDRAIGPHAFRSAVITAFYEAGASQSDMATLADIMAHDLATARAHYHRPIWAEQAVATNDKMARLLLGQA